MRIESVEIINFRQYKNVNFQFKKGKSKDLHIILGNNGMGKTNLLNSITWCLYGKEPHLGNEKKARSRVNIKGLQEARNKGESKCEVKVSITINADEKTLIFERKQYVKTDESLFEHMPETTLTCIQPSGNTVHNDDETIKNYINMYIPGIIQEYFFFDGEQLDKYFISGKGEKIKDAIFNISHVKLLASMRERLSAVIGDLQDLAAKEDPDVQKLNISKKETEKNRDNFMNLIKECNTQISNSDAEILKCNEYLAGKEGVPDKEKEFQDFNYKLIQKNANLITIQGDIKKFIKKYKILFSFYPSLYQTLNKINQKEHEGMLPPNVDLKFLERMLRYHHCYICNRDMDDNDEESVKQLMGQIQLSTGISTLLVKIKGSIEELLELIKDYPAEREQLFKRKKETEEEILNITEQIDIIDIFLKNYADKEKIRQMHELRSVQGDIKRKNEINKIKYELELEKKEKELFDLGDKIKKSIDKQEALKSIRRQIEFTQKSKSIVTEIEDEMMTEVREKITTETIEIFKKLDWKKETFSHIVLDDHYNLELFDVYGYPMVGSCSSAERALLALSFTLALQKVSGYDAMLFIDTPVGRVDPHNRANFAEVLSQISESKQVIMTFTNSEYSAEIRNEIEQDLSTFVELKTNDEEETYLK